MKKFLALLLSVAMLLSVGLTPALAAEPDAVAKAPVQFADMSDDHWAKSSIDRWSGYGIVNGDEHGHVNADKPLRRCEMAQVLVNLLGLTQEAENTFGDLTGKEWYAGTILKCAAAGIMKGDGVNCNPVAPVSREEAIVMFGRAIGVRPAADPDLTKFDDAGDVADWAAPYMAPLTQMGILNGVDDGSKVAPKGEMNRASTFALLDKAITVYASEPGEYKAEDPNGFVVVNSAAEEAGQVVISGETAGVVVSTGTTDAVAVKDLVADTVKVDAPVDVTVEGRDTVLGSVQLNDAANVDVAKGVQVDTLEANAPATVTNKGTVDNLVANDAVKVDNQGTVKDVAVNASDVVVDGKAPQKMEVAEGVTAPTNSKGDTVKPTNRPSSGGSTASGPATPVTTLYTVTVTQPTGVELHADPTRAEAGATITVTAATKDGYELQDVIYSVSEDVSHNVVMKSSGDNTFRGTFTMPAGNVRVSATAKAVDTPDTPVVNEYTIEVDTVAHGVITTEPAGKAEEGATVRVTATPATGYELDTLTYTPEGGAPVDIKANKSFRMPGKAVTVRGSFKKMPVATMDIDCLMYELKNVEVEFGTSKEDVIKLLPTAVDVYLVDHTLNPRRLNITSWECADYNPNEAGKYVFKGTLALTEDLSNSNNVTADVVVIVKAAPTVAVTGVSLNETSLNLDLAGTKTATLTATVAPENATNKTVTWTSDAESVATVDSKGVVTAVAAGTANITATAGNKTASCAVTVTDSSKVTVSNVNDLIAALKLKKVKEITVSANFVNGGTENGGYQQYDVIYPVTIKGETGAAVQGSFVVKSTADGTEFNNLTIKALGWADGTNAMRNCISANVKTLTVTGCTLETGKPGGELANGLMILPSDATVTYTITGNTFKGFKNTTVTGEGTPDKITWASTGLMITGGLTKDYLGMDAKTLSADINITAAQDEAFITGNTFTDCKTDYVRDTYTGGSQKIIARCNSTVGTSLNFGKAAETATYYIKGAISRESDTTLKSGTTLKFMGNGSLAIKDGSRLYVENGATINGTVSGDVVYADVSGAYDVKSWLATQMTAFELKYYNLNGTQKTHIYDTAWDDDTRNPETGYVTAASKKFDKAEYMLYVGEMDKVGSLTLNDESDPLSLDKEVRIGIGYDNFLHTVPYMVENGKVFVNSILMAAKAKAGNGTVKVSIVGKDVKSNNTEVDATLNVTYKLFEYPAENNLFVTAVAAPDTAGGVEFKDNTSFTGSNTAGYTVEGTFTDGQHERVLMGVNLSTAQGGATLGKDSGVGPVIVYEENSTRYVLGFTELGETLYGATYSYGTYPVFSKPSGGSRTVTVLIPGAGSVKMTFNFTPKTTPAEPEPEPAA